MADLFDQEKMYRIHEINIINESKAEGIAEGKVKGKAEGKAEGREDAAIEMLKDSYEPSVINKLTKVSLDRINELKFILFSSPNLENE